MKITRREISKFPLIRLGVLVIANILVFATLTLRAQGTLYLSNLEESGTGFNIGDGSQSFVTGTASNGYILNYVTLLMGNMLDNASNFNVSIFSDNDGQAGTSLAMLNGNENPQTAGQYSYTASGLIFAPDTAYWIVAVCDSSSTGGLMPPGGYTWQFTDSPNYSSGDGWNVGAGNTGFDNSIFQFSINATPVPEPSSLTIIVSGIGLFMLIEFFRRNLQLYREIPCADLLDKRLIQRRNFVSPIF